MPTGMGCSSNTIANIAKAIGGLKMPNMEGLGLGISTFREWIKPKLRQVPGGKPPKLPSARIR